MSDMVEKVARAIDPEAFDLPRDTRGAAQKWRLRTAKARKLARAAIEAMREPTEGMVEVGVEDILRGPSISDFASWGDLVASRYRMMIDAARSNTGEPNNG